MPTGIKLSPALKAIYKQIAELERRAKHEIKREKHRRSILAECKKRKLTRADLFWMIEQMPKLRITQKSRLERIEARKKQEANGRDANANT